LRTAGFEDGGVEVPAGLLEGLVGCEEAELIVLFGLAVAGGTAAGEGAGEEEGWVAFLGAIVERKGVGMC